MKRVTVVLDDTTAGHVLYPIHVLDEYGKVIPYVMSVRLEISPAYSVPPAKGVLVIEDRREPDGKIIVPVEIYFQLVGRGSLD